MSAPREEMSEQSSPADEDQQATDAERLSTADLSGRGQDESSTQPDQSSTQQDQSSTQQQGADQAQGANMAEEAGRTQDGGQVSEGEAAEPLLPSDETATFEERWREIQVRFVDEPQGSVRDADALVAELMQRLAATFADERGRLETEWGRGSDVSTEDLRRALQHYRSFFQRLLAT